jgi:hypothetical protein
MGERLLGVLLENRAPTQVLILIDLSAREALVEDPHWIETSAFRALLVVPSLIVIEVSAVTAPAPVSVSVDAVSVFSITMLSMLLVPVATLHAVADSNKCTEEREKR